jgi:hypothetical protein
VGKLNDVQQRSVTFAPLDSADIIAMEMRQLSEPFLCQTAFRTQFTQPSPELDSWIVSGRHRSSLAATHYESTHDKCDILSRS